MLPWQVVFCGATDFDTIWSGTRNEKYADIHRPSRISVLQGKKVTMIASGPSAAHSVIVAEDGCYTFGYNKWGQLGHGDGGWPTQWRVPRKLPLRDYIVGAACGKTHTMLLADNGRVWVMGGNEYGQLGCGHKKPIKDPYMLSGIPTIDRVAVGQDFSAMLTSEGTVLACGKPEYGQLGNGTNGEYFITASKLDFQCETRPILVEGKDRASFTAVRHLSRPLLPTDRLERPPVQRRRGVDLTASASHCALRAPPAGLPKISDIKCGNHHTAAMTTEGAVYTWGFGGYGRLGHNDPADCLTPKEVETFSEEMRTRAGGPLGPPDHAVGITCGSACTLAIRASGKTMFWGKTKTSGEATMYPKVIEDLQGWRVRAFGAGNASIVVGAEKSVISWGPSPTRGELGYGKGEKTSSTKPKKMDPLEGYIVTQIACEQRHDVFCSTLHRETEKQRERVASSAGLTIHLAVPASVVFFRAGGHSHTLMVIAGENEEGLKKLAKFKPKPPKDIGERPVDPKKAKKKVAKKKKAAAEGEDEGEGEDDAGGDDEPDAKRAKA